MKHPSGGPSPASSHPITQGILISFKSGMGVTQGIIFVKVRFSWACDLPC